MLNDISLTQICPPLNKLLDYSGHRSFRIQLYNHMEAKKIGVYNETREAEKNGVCNKTGQVYLYDFRHT